MIVNEELKHLIVFLLKRGFSLACASATLIMIIYQLERASQITTQLDCLLGDAKKLIILTHPFCVLVLQN